MKILIVTVPRRDARTHPPRASGLDPGRRYRVRVQTPTTRALGEVGLATPLLDVDTLILVRATAID